LKRREFVVLLGGAAAWPTAAGAQQLTIPLVGFISGRSAHDSAGELVAFRRGLADSGYVEGRNVAIEFHWANGRYDRLSTHLAEFIRRNVAVLVAVGAIEVVRAAKSATHTTPIVFGTGTDPVKEGFVRSLNRPGANVTGATFSTGFVGAKRLSLLRELAPHAKVIALLVNEKRTIGKEQTRDVLEAGRALAQRVIVLHAGTREEIDAAFATLAQHQVGALLVAGDPFYDSQRDRIISLAARHAVPALYQYREYAVAGGLASYGASITDMYGQVGVYVGRILNGEKPQDMPVLLPTNFELVINLKIAKALGVTVPDSLLVAATEVIE
jgi:putative ABC transport system substrate-binding protein